MDLPVAFVYEVVASGAKLDEVGDVGGAVVLPVLDVMGFALFRR